MVSVLRKLFCDIKICVKMTTCILDVHFSSISVQKTSKLVSQHTEDFAYMIFKISDIFKVQNFLDGMQK